MVKRRSYAYRSVLTELRLANSTKSGLPQNQNIHRPALGGGSEDPIEGEDA